MEFDFNANQSVESLDKVPEIYRGLYGRAEDGKYAILPTAKALVDAYMGTTRSFQETRTNNKKLADENAARRVAIKAIEDLAKSYGIEGDDIVAGMKGHIESLVAKVAGGKELQINLDKIKAEAEKRIQEVTQSKDGELTAMRKTVESYLIGEAAMKALSAEKGSPDLLLPHIRSQIKVVKDGENYVARVVDSNGDIRSNGAGGWLDVHGLVKELKANPVFARAFESEVNTGTGKKPASSNTTVAVTKPEGKSATDKIASGLAKGQYTRADGRMGNG